MCWSVGRIGKYFVSNELQTSRITQNLSNDVFIVNNIINIYIFTDTFIRIMFHLLTAENSPDFNWKVDMYGVISHLYIIQLCIFLIFFLIDSHDQWAQSRVSSKGQIFSILLHLIPCFSNLYIIDRKNSRLPSRTVCATYLD